MATLQYYNDMIGTEDVQITAVLSADQASSILKSHDVGVDNLTNEETSLVDLAVSRIKDSIRP